MLDQDNPFWRFSLAVYDAPGVEAECLALQGALGVDVNILLFCAWAGHRRKTIDDTQLAAIEQQVAGWQGRVVRPLRALRRDIKSMPEMARAEIQQFRQEVAAAELRSERIEQALLFEAANKLLAESTVVSATDSIRHNITAYLTRAVRGGAYFEPVALIAATSAYKESNT